MTAVICTLIASAAGLLGWGMWLGHTTTRRRLELHDAESARSHEAATAAILADKARAETRLKEAEGLLRYGGTEMSTRLYAQMHARSELDALTEWSGPDLLKRSS